MNVRKKTERSIKNGQSSEKAKLILGVRNRKKTKNQQNKKQKITIQKTKQMCHTDTTKSQGDPGYLYRVSNSCI